MAGEVEKGDSQILRMQLADVMNPRARRYRTPFIPIFFRSDCCGLVWNIDINLGMLMMGITAVIPLASLNQVPAEPFEWLVPGQLGEKEN